MSIFWERVFYVLSWLFQGSSYLSPVTYGKLHRMHHAYADTEKDVHSPIYDKTFFKLMNKTKSVYHAIHEGKMKVDKQFYGAVHEWKWFDNFAHSWTSRIGWTVVYILFYVQFATEWWMYLFIPIHIVLSPIHGGIINWFAHKFGYRNYDVADTSTNLFPIEIFMLGEALHNNHHKKSASANFAQKWFEFDPVYVIILLLDKIGIIQLNKATTN